MISDEDNKKLELGSNPTTGKSSLPAFSEDTGKVNIARMGKRGVTFTPATNFKYEEKVA